MYQVTLPRFIEVEISSYCNRTCSWCPNGWSERGRKKHFIPDRIWRSLIADLSSTSFDGEFAFHNYNEPMADLSFFDKLSYARAHLPQAKLILFTNGDYLTERSFQILCKYGIDKIRITLYPRNSEFHREPKLEHITKYLNKLSFNCDNLELKDLGRHIEGFLTSEEGVHIHLIAPRIKFYNNRGAAIPLTELELPHLRTAPCYLPFRSAAIDFHGNLKLCCEIFDGSLPENQIYIIGNLVDNTFRGIWNSDRMNSLRRKVANAEFSDLKACQKCKFMLSDTQLSELATS